MSNLILFWHRRDLRISESEGGGRVLPRSQPAITGRCGSSDHLYDWLFTVTPAALCQKAQRILSVAFSSDGKTFASVSGNNTVKVWRLPR